MDLHTKHKKNESSFRVCTLGWTNFVPNIIKIAFKMNRWEFEIYKSFGILVDDVNAQFS